MAITPGNLAFRNAAAGNSLIYSHTVVAGSDLFLLVGAMFPAGGDTVTGVTYASVSMVDVSTPTTAQQSIWGLVAPATGANTVVITFNHYAGAWATTADWAGVDQTAPIASGAADNTSGATATSTSLTCPAGGYIWSAGRNSYTGSGSFSAGSGTTLIGSHREGGGGNGGFAAYRSTTGSVVVNLPGSAGGISMQTVALQPSGGGGGGGFQQKWNYRLPVPVMRASVY